MDIKWKDKPTDVTINQIKLFFETNGIELIENWINNSNAFYSVGLGLKGMPIFSNGKGVTKSYAEASAYAEMMERLQNYVFARMKSLIFSNTKSIHCEFPSYNKIDIRNNISLWLKNVEKDISISEVVLDMLINTSTDSSDSFVKMIVYKSETGTLELPSKIVDDYYGTNGMCAGNTKEEALVQGLSEIIERYVIKRVLNDKIIPIDCTEYICDKYPEVRNYINILVRNSNRQVILKNYNYLLGIPVYALLYIEENSRYFVKFGVHPNEEIAIERCFTELLQGQKMESITGLSDIIDFRRLTTENMMSIYIDGRGNYPMEFFSKSTKSYALDTNISNNNEALIKLTSVINNMGYEIYINDTSTDIINSFHIIIPGMSEIAIPKEEHIKYNYNKMMLQKLLYKDELGEIECDEALTLMKKLNIKDSDKISGIYKNLCIINVKYLDLISVIDIKIAINARLQNYKLLLSYVKEVYINFRKYRRKDMDQQEIKYYQYLILLLESKLDSSIDLNVFHYFFDNNTIEQVEMDLKNSFSYFLDLNYCNKCKYFKTNDCVDSKIKELFYLFEDIKKCAMSC